MLNWVEGNVFFYFMGSSLWLQDSEGFVVAAPGPSQCSRPQVSVGRLPLEQDSAQVPRRGCKQHCELSNKRGQQTCVVGAAQTGSFLLLFLSLTLSFPLISAC